VDHPSKTEAERCDEEMIARKCVVGIDPSVTSSGVAALWADRQICCVSHQRIRPKRKPRAYPDRFTRYKELVAGISGAVIDANPNLIVIEGYSYASRGRSTITLSEFGGLLRQELIGRFDCPIIEVAPSRLKKFVVAGNASKERVHDVLKAQFPVFGPITQLDELDACVAATLGLYVLAVLDPSFQVQLPQTFANECIIDTVNRIKSNDGGATEQNAAWHVTALIDLL